MKYYTVDVVLRESNNLIDEWQRYSGYDLEKAKEIYWNVNLGRGKELELRVYEIPSKLEGDELDEAIRECFGYDIIEM